LALISSKITIFIFSTLGTAWAGFFIYSNFFDGSLIISEFTASIARNITDNELEKPCKGKFMEQFKSVLHICLVGLKISMQT
jgi:hypothetical protein